MSSVKILQAGEGEGVAEASPVVAAPVAQAAPPIAPAAPPTPSATLVAAAASVGQCVAQSGHTYQFKKLLPLDRMLIAKAIGAELMGNAVYASYSFVACSITHINGAPEGMPTSIRAVEARVQRIGGDWDELNASMKAAFASPVADEDDDDA